MKNPQHIGLLGGTFDPIHLGHLYIAEQVCQALALDQVEFIPCHSPAHRAAPVASDHDRKLMLELALADHPKFQLNTLELERRGISYTIDTLKARSQPQQILYWIIGFDAFLQFHTWHAWEDILRYCHLIVVNRPNYPTHLPAPLLSFYEKHHTNEPSTLRHHQQGKIAMLHVPPCDISATAIRAALQQDKLPKALLPVNVAHFLAEHPIYRQKP